MADDRHRQDRSQQQQNQSDDRSAPASRYPPAPAPEDHLHARGPGDDPRSAMATTVTLRSIHSASYPAQHAPPSNSPVASRRFSHDPRYASPATVNGYPPPSPGQQPHAPYLLPLQTNPSDPGSPAYPPPDQRQAAYYDDRRPPPSPYPDPHHPHHPSPQYPPEGYYYRGPPAPPPPPPPNGYPRAPPGAYPEYAQPPGGASALAQAAPRQRTSIACRYCRKRKIRCSGYQNTPGGKCQNCARMNQECIFQPVSSSSTAFIPVSAVPGGIPPGTQLFGAYGQPLGPNTVPVAPHPYPPAHHPAPAPAPAAAATAPPPMYYSQAQPRAPPSAQSQPGQSPTESFSYGEDTTQMAGRRRRRTPEDRDEAYRLPPQRGAGPSEDDGRRRSPAELSNQSSPGGYVHVSHTDARRSPRSAASATSAAGQSSGGQGTRSPGAQNGSSGTSTPGRQPSQQQQQQQGGGAGAGGGQGTTPASVMSLSNVVEKNDIDRGMIDRLNRPRDAQLSPSTPP